MWCLELAWCCYAAPTEQQANLFECQDYDVTYTFDFEGWAKCPDNSFMHGMYRGDASKNKDQGIHLIEDFKCCKAKAQRPADVPSNLPGWEYFYATTENCAALDIWSTVSASPLK